MCSRPSPIRMYSTKSVVSASRASPVRWSRTFRPLEPGTKWTRSPPRSACGLPSRSCRTNDDGAVAIAASTTSAREQDPGARGVGREPVIEEPLPQLLPADLHADLGQEALRLLDDRRDELRLEDLRLAGARPAPQASVTRSRQCGMCTSKPEGRDLRARARAAPPGRRGRGRPSSGSPRWPGWRPVAKFPIQSSSSDSSECAEKPLIDLILHRTCRTWPSSLTVVAPAWRCAPSVPDALVADEQDRRGRVVDEVAQVGHDASAGQHPVRGHDHVRPRRRRDRLRFIGRAGDRLLRVVERGAAGIEELLRLVVVELRVAPVDVRGASRPSASRGTAAASGSCRHRSAGPAPTRSPASARSRTTGSAARRRRRCVARTASASIWMASASGSCSRPPYVDSHRT